MHCSRPAQQAIFWHGSSSSPASTLRQLEAAALSGMHSFQHQLHSRSCHAPGQRSVAADRVVQHQPVRHKPVQHAAATGPEHRACSSTLSPAAASTRHLRRVSSSAAASSRQHSTVPSMPQQQASPPRQMRQQQHQQHQQHVQHQHQQQQPHQATQQQQPQQQPQQQQQHEQQQQQQGQGWRAAAAPQQTPERPDRLQRMLTVLLSSYSSCAADIADLLLAAEVSNCLNSIHLAAALSRLVRLAAASSASEAAAASECDVGGGAAYSAAAANDAGSDIVVTAVVPQLEAQWEELQFFKAVAAEHTATSRWHLQPDAAEQYTSLDPGQMDPEYEHQQHLVEQLAAAAAEAAGRGMSVPTLTSTCWALAHLQAQPPAALLQAAGAALAHQAKGLLAHHSAPQQRWSHIWRQQQQEMADRPRRIIILMWALSKIATDLDDILPQQQQPQQQLDGEGQSNHVHVQQADGSSVGSISDLLQLILNALTPHTPDLTSQALLLLLWAAATWTKHSSSSSGGVVPPAAAAGLLSATAAAMESQSLTCRGLSVVMWSCARLGLSPDAAWLSAWAAALQCALPAAGPQDLAVSAWGLATLGCPPPPDWLADFSRRAAAVAPHMAAQELPVLLWAYGRLRYRPPAAVAHALLQRGGRLASAGALSPQGLSLLLWACGVVGLELPGRWVDGVLAAAGGYLPLFRPTEASSLWVGLVKLGHIPPPGWLEAWWGGSKGLVAAAGGQQMVLLLWAAVKLGQAPPRAWMDAWLAAAQGAMARGEVSGQGYGLMWDALTQMAPTGTIPSAEWLDTYFTASRVTGVMDQLDALTVEKTLSGLAAVSGQLQEGLELPLEWVDSVLSASLPALPQAKLVSMANMLQAAGQLALPLSPIWLAVSMCCIQQLLLQGGVLPPSVQYKHDSSSSSTHSRRFVRTIRAGSRSSCSMSAGSRSMVLSARLERRWCQLCLQRVLFGLRAQQMLNPGPRRRLWHKAREVAAGAMLAAQDPEAAAAADSSDVSLSAAEAVGPLSSSVGSSTDSSSGSDVLAVWPWLAPAVHAVWLDPRSAHQALQALSMR